MHCRPSPVTVAVPPLLACCPRHADLIANTRCFSRLPVLVLSVRALASRMLPHCRTAGHGLRCNLAEPQVRDLALPVPTRARSSRVVAWSNLFCLQLFSLLFDRAPFLESTHTAGQHGHQQRNAAISRTEGSTASCTTSSCTTAHELPGNTRSALQNCPDHAELPGCHDIYMLATGQSMHPQHLACAGCGPSALPLPSKGDPPALPLFPIFGMAPAARAPTKNAN